MKENNLSITILGSGTSQGVPVINCHCEVCSSEDYRDKRLRTSAVIEKGSTVLLIDIGPDFRQQAMRAEIEHIDAVLLTHEHSDHTAGIDDIRPYCFRQNETIPFCGLDRVLEDLRQRFRYVFAEKKYPGAPEIDLKPIDEKAICIGEIKVQAISIMHGILPIYGYLFDDKIAYLTDCSSLSEEAIQKLRNIDILIINALRKHRHHSHLALEQALEIRKEINPDRCLLTHMSHHIGRHAQLISELPPGVEPAYDELKLTV